MTTPRPQLRSSNTRRAQQLGQVGGLERIVERLSQATGDAEAVWRVLSCAVRGDRPCLDRGIANPYRPFEGGVGPMHDEIGKERGRITGWVRPQHLAHDWPPVLRPKPLERRAKLLARGLVVVRLDDPLRLATTEVHAHPPVLIGGQREGPRPAPAEYPGQRGRGEPRACIPRQPA